MGWCHARVNFFLLVNMSENIYIYIKNLIYWKTICSIAPPVHICTYICIYIWNVRCPRTELTAEKIRQKKMRQWLGNNKAGGCHLHRMHACRQQGSAAETVESGIGLDTEWCTANDVICSSCSCRRLESSAICGLHYPVCCSLSSPTSLFFSPSVLLSPRYGLWERLISANTLCTMRRKR